MEYKLEVTFDEDDYDSLRETYWNASLEFGEDVHLTNDELKLFWDTLPEDIQLDAIKWGISDTEVRERMWEYACDNYSPKNKRK